jgi:hypothetical protein
MLIKYKKTNWLNIILTSILYSDNSKTKLSGNNSFLRFINNNFKLNISNYKDILSLFKLNKKFIEYYLYYLFLPKFIKKLDMSYITLDYYKSNYYYNISENSTYNNDFIKYDIPNNEFDKYKKNIQSLKKNPDYIIINLWTGPYELSSYAKNIEIISKYMPKLESILNFKNYNIKTKGLSDYKDNIIFNNDNYKLDSCIFENDSGIMAGITYNNKKYIYRINTENSSKFMKYKWDIINKNGYKTLIYVKTTNNKVSIVSDNKDIIEKISSKPDNYYIKLIKDKLTISKDKQLEYFYKYLKTKVKMTKEGIIKKTKEGIVKMTKEDYIKKIKKEYPYYVNLNKYKIDELKQIYNKDCKSIHLYYDGYNSCYIDSLLVSLFNANNDIIKKTILDAPLKYYEECPKLLDYGTRIRDELIKIYEIISLQKETSEITECTNFRLLLQKYYNSYKKHINNKYDVIEWTNTQNDYADILTFLTIIFNIPNTLKFKLNNRIEYKYFVDLFSLDELLTTDKIYIKNFYPKYERTFESENKYGKIEIFKKRIEYLAAPFLFILFNRILLSEKILTKIIPSLKIKLKENSHNLYLNSIIIHRGGLNKDAHYTCLYECKGIWYEYNDLNVKNREIIGTFDKIIENDDYTENISGLLYC